MPTASQQQQQQQFHNYYHHSSDRLSLSHTHTCFVHCYLVGCLNQGKKAGALNKTRPTTVRLQQKGASWASQIANGAVRRKDLERAAKAKYTALAKSTGRKVVGVVRKPKRLRRRRAFA